jgi:hypothetical protein
VQALLRDSLGALLDQPLALARLTVSAIGRLTIPPAMEHPQRATLGNVATLLGYDLVPVSVRPGEAISLTLNWQARAGSSGVSYTVFTHLLGADQRIYAQHDGIPGEGTRPTTGWIEGEIIVDHHDLVVRADAPAGDYLLEIGLYDPASDQRVPVLDEGGASAASRVLLGTRVRVGR